MSKSQAIPILCAAFALSGCGGPGPDANVPKAQKAEDTSKDIGKHVVHFNAQSTDQVSADVARAYNMVRSKNRAMLIVSVVGKSSGETVPATLEVKARNLTGQLKNVSMRRVDDQKAIYYIGETAVANRETLVFDLNITPQDVPSPYAVRFKRQFYTD